MYSNSFMFGSLKLLLFSGVLSFSIGMLSCQKRPSNSADVDSVSAGRNNGSSTNNPAISFSNKSVTPAFVKMMPGFEKVQIYTLISSDDVLPEAPNFVFGAQPDGSGLLKTPTGDGYIFVTNHEILRSVSRTYLDNTFTPKKAEYIVDAEGGMWRLCSATMAIPSVHGFGPLFITAGETGPDSRVHAIDPFGSVADKKRTDRVLPALGRAGMENALPLPKTAYAGKTIIIIGEDDANGQLLAYVSNTVGDLVNGQLYFLRRKDLNTQETEMAVGSTYSVEFVPIDNAATATGAEIAAQSIAKNCIQFGRVEDIDYRKGGGGHDREIYFAVTGLANVTGKTKWGRVYKLILDQSSPLSGTLMPVADGNRNPGNDLINPDNICATTNYVYIQEDGDAFYPEAKHDSYIWQYDIAKKQYKPFLTMWHRREDASFNSINGYNQTGENRFGSWEFGAMIDVSSTIGSSNVFLLNIHAHTWQKDRFLNADGTAISNNKEGGQTVILRNVPQ